MVNGDCRVERKEVPTIDRSPAMHALRCFLLILLGFIALGGCGDEGRTVNVAGDAENGRLLLRQYGCATCHQIPGVATATGNVGPPLQKIATRVYLAGVIPNTPENMVRWIRAPQKIDPMTAMPDMQVTEEHARDIVAYLYRLR
jgi:cytochrome c1